MVKKTSIFLSFFILLIYACSTNITNTLTIAVDNAQSPVSSVIYIEANTCAFNNAQYIGVYNDTLHTLDFTNLGETTSVSSSDIQMFVCVGNVTGSYNNVAVTCSLQMLDKSCVCNYAASATADQIVTSQKIADGINVLMTKATSAKNSLFNNPNLCTSQTGDINPRHVCPCNLIQ